MTSRLMVLNHLGIGAERPHESERDHSTIGLELRVMGGRLRGAATRGGHCETLDRPSNPKRARALSGAFRDAVASAV